MCTCRCKGLHIIPALVLKIYLIPWHIINWNSIAVDTELPNLITKCTYKEDMYHFTTTAINLTIWLGNLLLSRNAFFSLHSEKKHFFWHWFVVDSLGCASWVHNILITVMTLSLLIRAQTTINHIRFLKFIIINENKNENNNDNSTLKDNNDNSKCKLYRNERYTVELHVLGKQLLVWVIGGLRNEEFTLVFI